jgi:hypothetical protein
MGRTWSKRNGDKSPRMSMKKVSIKSVFFVGVEWLNSKCKTKNTYLSSRLSKRLQ